MQALAKAAAGKSYTIKWMFGIPEVLDKIRKCKIDEGSEITVIQNSGRDSQHWFRCAVCNRQEAEYEVCG